MKGITEKTAKARHVIISKMKAINSKLKSTPKSPEVKRNIRLPAIYREKSKILFVVIPGLYMIGYGKGKIILKFLPFCQLNEEYQGWENSK